jgi:hypothetical protein
VELFAVEGVRFEGEIKIRDRYQEFERHPGYVPHH